MKVAILTPAYDGRAHLAHNRTVRSLRNALERAGHQTIYGDACHAANLPRLRNWLTAEALHWGADVTLWLDSDVGGDTDELIDLILSQHPIIGVAPQCRPHTMFEQPRVAFGVENGRMRYREDGLVEVKEVASACVKIDAAVFHALAETEWCKRVYSPDQSWPAKKFYRNYWWYELEPSGVCDDDGEEQFIADGEDWFLCRRALKDLGIQPLLDPKKRLIHHEGRMKLTVNFWDLYGEALEGSREDAR